MHIKRKTFEFSKEISYLSILDGIWKNYRHFRNYLPQIFEYAKLHVKTKYTYIFDKKCFIWIFSGWNSKKPFSYLKLTPSNLFTCKVWWKIKILKFGTKNARFVSFWAGIWKLYYHIWNQHPEIYLIIKFREKMKMPTLGNALFGYFLTGIWKIYRHIWNQHLHKFVTLESLIRMMNFAFSKSLGSAFWRFGYGSGTAFKAFSNKSE